MPTSTWIYPRTLVSHTADESSTAEASGGDRRIGARSSTEAEHQRGHTAHEGAAQRGHHAKSYVKYSILYSYVLTWDCFLRLQVYPYLQHLANWCYWKLYFTIGHTDSDDRVRDHSIVHRCRGLRRSARNKDAPLLRGIGPVRRRIRHSRRARVRVGWSSSELHGERRIDWDPLLSSSSRAAIGQVQVLHSSCPASGTPNLLSDILVGIVEDGSWIVHWVVAGVVWKRIETSNGHVHRNWLLVGEMRWSGRGRELSKWSRRWLHFAMHLVCWHGLDLWSLGTLWERSVGPSIIRTWVLHFLVLFSIWRFYNNSLIQYSTRTVYGSLYCNYSILN